MKRSGDIASLLQKIIKMGDSLLDDCLVTFIERDIFLQLSDGDHPHFMAIGRRMPDKKCRIVLQLLRACNMNSVCPLFL